MTHLISLYSQVVRRLGRLTGALPLLARLTFALVLLRYFWNSALTKLDGPLTLSANAYAQIFPKRLEAAGHDHTTMPAWTDFVVFAGTYAEFILPALIVLGLLTRLAALGMIGIIAVQSLTDLFGHGGIAHEATLGAWLDAAPDGVILDQRLLWLTLLATLVVKGGGWLSLDAAFRNAPWVRPAFPQPAP